MMGKDSTRHRCRWVCDRLPLLDGGELAGTERRDVESHLVSCPACQARRVRIAGVFHILRTTATELPPALTANVGTDSPSLWPALQRQIRESRHEGPRSVFSEAVFWLEHPLYRIASLAAAGLIAIVLTSVTARSWVRAQLISANTLTNAATRPVRITPIPVHSALDFTLDVAKTESESSPRVADRLPPWFGYDLDRGTPMNNPDTGHIKASY